MADNVCKYGAPTAPLGREAVVIMSAGALIVRVKNFATADDAVLSVTWMVKFVVPGMNGVPLMTPLEASKVMPRGSVPPPKDQL